VTDKALGFLRGATTFCFGAYIIETCSDRGCLLLARCVDASTQCLIMAAAVSLSLVDWVQARLHPRRSAAQTLHARGSDGVLTARHTPGGVPAVQISYRHKSEHAHLPVTAHLMRLSP
jgi:hypothetical protein